MKKRKTRSARTALTTTVIVVALVGVCVCSFYSLKNRDAADASVSASANGGTSTGKLLTRYDAAVENDNVAVAYVDDAQEEATWQQDVDPRVTAEMLADAQRVAAQGMDSPDQDLQDDAAQEGVPAEDAAGDAADDIDALQDATIKTVDASATLDVISSTVSDGVLVAGAGSANEVSDTLSDEQTGQERALMAADTLADTADEEDAPATQEQIAPIEASFAVMDLNPQAAQSSASEIDLQPEYIPEPNYDPEPEYVPEVSYDSAPEYVPEPEYDPEPAYVPEPAYDPEPEYTNYEPEDLVVYDNVIDDSYYDDSDYEESGYEEPYYEEPYYEESYYEESYESDDTWYDDDSEPDNSYEEDNSREWVDDGEWIYDYDADTWVYVEAGSYDDQEDSYEENNWEESYDDGYAEEDWSEDGEWIYDYDQDQWVYVEGRHHGDDSYDNGDDWYDDSNDWSEDTNDDWYDDSNDWSEDTYDDWYDDSNDWNDDSDEYEEDDWYEEESNYSSLGQQIVNYAMGYVGVTPYVAGGRSLYGGTDCSGFVSLIYGEFGIYCSPASLAYDGSSFGYIVSYDQARAGDIAVYGGGSHVAIYAGDGCVVHCSSPENGTVYWNMNYRSDLSWFLRVVD